MPPTTAKSENRKLISRLARQLSSVAEILEDIIVEQRAQAHSAKLRRDLTKRLIKYCMAEEEAGAWPETLSIDGDPSRAFSLPEPAQVSVKDRSSVEAELAKLTDEERAKRAALGELRKRIGKLRSELEQAGPAMS